jgi:4-hydroxythreonine-4-phosphate dehydrogenase
MNKVRYRLGVTVGDPTGIGPEIVFKALEYFARFKTYRSVEFHIMCSEDIFRAHFFSDFEERLHWVKSRLKLLFINPDDRQRHLNFQPGAISADSGLFSTKAFLDLLTYSIDQHLDAFVTGPINKKALLQAGIAEVDHTEMMRKFYKVPVDTMFKTKALRIFFFTKHIPLMELRSFLNQNDLIVFFQRCHEYNRLLGFENSSIAVAGINPHASDGGRFGDEENTILLPAILKAREKGIPVEGPFPADSIYFQALKGKFGSVISLYHDQGHIAAKMVDFFRTVSFSLGAPVLRLSVDHGTATDIAGKGIASPASMIQALKEAIKYGKTYRKHVIEKL